MSIKKHTISDSSIIIDDKDIDIYEQFDIESLPVWEPSIKLPPVSNVKTMFFDIETESNFNIKLWNTLETRDSIIAQNRIMMIGLMLSNGKHLILDWTNYDERYMLEYFFNVLWDLKPDVLTGYNIWNFDIPFIIGRCEFLGIKHPFINGKIKEFKTAVINNQPVRFYQKFLKFDNHQINIIDTYLQVLSVDFVARKLENFSLKRVTEQWGLRDKNVRVELTPAQMMNCYKSGNVDLMSSYLYDDLKDTKLIYDRIFPTIYYQKMFLPNWSLQSLATSGNGSKWQSLLEEQYNYSPNSDLELAYQGGYTEGKAGIYKDVEKIDVSSLYPSIMLNYGVCSRKDNKKILLRILKYITAERLRLKKMPDVDSQALQGVLKIFINSAYGALGTRGIGFNDYIAAAKVTAYGRSIVKRMKELLLEYGCTICEIDTDGIYYQPNGKDGNDVLMYVQSFLPKGILIDREKLGSDEHKALLFYVPPVDISKSDDGLRKNYVIIGSHQKIIAKGKFAKRNRSKFEREFQINLLKEYSISYENAIEYYNKIKGLILSGKMPIEELTITRTPAKSEKKLPELVPINPETGKCTYYYGLQRVSYVTAKKGLEKIKYENLPTNKGYYSISYYYDKLEDMFNELKPFLR